MPQQLDSTVSTASSGTSLSTASTAPIAPNDFWWQWPCSSARFATGRNGSRNLPSPASRARNSSSSSTSGTPLASAGSSSRKPSTQLGSSPTTGMPRATNGASAAIERSASLRASSTSPTDRNVRPQQSGGGRCTPYPARSSTVSAAAMFSGSK